jgi:MFS family permease
MATATTAHPYPGGLTRQQVFAWRNSMFVLFSVCGLGLASWVSRVPAVRDALDASTAEMGILIFGIALGSIIGLLGSSHLIARVGARTALTICLTIGPLGFIIAGIGASVGPSFAIVFVGLTIFGAGLSISDVAINVSGAAIERVLRRTIMPIYHAFFSIGTMIGAALGALAEFAGLPIVAHVGIIAVGMVAAANLALRHVQHENILEVGENAVAADDHSKSWQGRLSIWRDPRTIFIGLIVLGMSFAEGAANDWLALATVDGYFIPNEVGAIMFGVFVTAMTVARLVGVLVLDRFGRVPVLRGSALLAMVGLIIFIFGSPTIWLAVLGVIFWGLGSALGFPVGMSAAADEPKTAAARVSAVATIGYIAFLVGPPVLGFLGETFGILNSLLVVLVLVTVAGVASGSAREPRALSAGDNNRVS